MCRTRKQHPARGHFAPPTSKHRQLPDPKAADKSAALAQIRSKRAHLCSSPQINGSPQQSIPFSQATSDNPDSRSSAISHGHSPAEQPRGTSVIESLPAEANRQDSNALAGGRVQDAMQRETVQTTVVIAGSELDEDGTQMPKAGSSRRRKLVLEESEEQEQAAFMMNDALTEGGMEAAPIQAPCGQPASKEAEALVPFYWDQ